MPLLPSSTSQQGSVSECESEPIHTPGAIQPHGVLLVVEEPDLRIVQWSENARDAFGVQEALTGKYVSDFFESDGVERLREGLAALHLDGPNHVSAVLQQRSTPRRWTVDLHLASGILIAELQPEQQETRSAASLQNLIRRTISDLDGCRTLEEFCQSAAEHFREVTGFDRVMIYRFLEDQSGMVIGESLAEGVDSFLGLRYPASDIPQQARHLYLINPFRATADVGAAPVPLSPPVHPSTGKPLDMSFSTLRATSPFHIEYLQNMGVGASLSFSIVRQGQLWGLVACHHRTPKMLREDARGAGEILSRILGLQVGIKEEAQRKTYVDHLKRVITELSDRLRHSGDFAAALMAGKVNLLTAINAGGAALCTGSKIFCLGITPTTLQIEQLRKWLLGQPWQPVWSTEQLAAVYEPAGQWASVAAGVLALQLSQGSAEVVFWFRPELVEVVNWAGNPAEAAISFTGRSGLGPKRSFALWQEQVRGRSEPWKADELFYASQIRDEMSQALLQHRALEINRLNAELLRSNRELERFSAIASHDLQEPLRTITIYTELLLRQARFEKPEDAAHLTKYIRSATERMSLLVSSLLEYAQTGESKATKRVFPIREAIAVALDNLQARISESKASIVVSEVPEVFADRERIIQLFQNLISNALKYSKPQNTPYISIDAEDQGGNWLFSVSDNGIGFEPELSESIFEPFRRLHGRELSGSGLGLAICKRIVESAGGQIWAEGIPGVGATFRFTLHTALTASPVPAGH